MTWSWWSWPGVALFLVVSLILGCLGAGLERIHRSLSTFNVRGQDYVHSESTPLRFDAQRATLDEKSDLLAGHHSVVALDKSDKLFHASGQVGKVAVEGPGDGGLFICSANYRGPPGSLRIQYQHRVFIVRYNHSYRIGPIMDVDGQKYPLASIVA